MLISCALSIVLALFSYNGSAAPISNLVARDDGLIHLPLRHVRGAQSPGIHRRQDAVTLYNDNDIEYLVDLEVGTPSQSITLSLDTGSSDIWMYSPGSCSTCAGGVFDETKSSTAVDETFLGAFSIEYFDGTTASGSYITDVLTIGSATLANVTMAVVSEVSDSGYGIMGVGLDGLESGQPNYPNIIDQLYMQGVTTSRSYSVYLDDIQSATGGLLLGGYDSSKYSGDLVPFQIIPSSDGAARLNIEWTSLSISNGSSSNFTSIPSASFPYPAVLDTGYTLSVLPTDAFSIVQNAFDAQPRSDGTYSVDCDLGSGFIDFGFGTLTISVPFSELAVPTSGGTECMFGFIPAEQSVVSLGDTFLRSAYVYYDYDNMQISLAQAIWT